MLTWWRPPQMTKGSASALRPPHEALLSPPQLHSDPLRLPPSFLNLRRRPAKHLRTATARSVLDRILACADTHGMQALLRNLPQEALHAVPVRLEDVLRHVLRALEELGAREAAVPALALPLRALRAVRGPARAERLLVEGQVTRHRSAGARLEVGRGTPRASAVLGGPGAAPARRGSLGEAPQAGGAAPLHELPGVRGARARVEAEEVDAAEVVDAQVELLVRPLGLALQHLPCAGLRQPSERVQLGDEH
mmetsp:Transcript_15790/g.49648  ORF Transcript_15790/g.49648 Transcript_15790/m.49648 type:complete len:251 (-) Transcript_15790:1358-2110(-)